MKPTTNVYIILDRSYNAKRDMTRLRTLFMRYKRAMRLTPYKTKLHCICYNGKASYFSPDAELYAFGNPDLKAGLELLHTTMQYEYKYTKRQTRSVFLLFTSGTALWGWKQPLDTLYGTREFALGLRYVITTGNAEKFIPFTDTPERIVPYFSENRLLSLVETLHTARAC